MDYSRHYLTQAQFVLEATCLSDRVELLYGDVYSIGALEQQYDIVCYVGLAYHLRHPQLALDLVAHRCRARCWRHRRPLRERADDDEPGDEASGTGDRLADRPLGFLWGWEPTEQLFLDMITNAGFGNAAVVSTSPHRGEAPGRQCGNRTYGVADAPIKPAHVAIVDDKPLQPLADHWSRL